MSFGFSVGDFVACIVLIKDVADALDSSTGSASEVKELSDMLNSLKQALVSSELVYRQYMSIDIGDETKVVANIMIDGICSERQRCIEILDTFNKSLMPYKEAFIKGRGLTIVRQARKITWLFRKDGVDRLRRSIKERLEVLNVWAASLSQ